MKLRAVVLLACLCLLTDLSAQGIRIRRRPNAAAPAPCTTTISSGTNLNTTITNANAGDVVCLNAGTYSTGTTITNTGTNSPVVTIRPVSTSTAITFNSLDFTGTNNGLTFDAYQGGAGTWFTAGNVNFASGTQANLRILGIHITAGDSVINVNVTGTSEINHWTYNNVPCAISGGSNWRWITDGGTYPTQQLVLRNGTVDGNSADGVRFGDGDGLTVEDTAFLNIYEQNATEEANCHTDAIQQFGGADHGIIRDNYFQNDATGIAAYDGVAAFTISNNILDFDSDRRFAPIEWYADNAGSGGGSTIDHNTIVFHSGACFGPNTCGNMDITAKAGQSGSGTIITNNIVNNIYSGGDGTATVAANHHNLIKGTSAFAASGGSNVTGNPTYTSATPPTTGVGNIAGYALANGSAGENAASDGSDIGAVASNVLALLDTDPPSFWRSGLRSVFAWVVPPAPKIPLSYAVWKVKTALKYGEAAQARAWAMTAQRIARGL